MSACLEAIHSGVPEWIKDRRNKVASVVAGLLFFGGWWIAIDAAAVYADKKNLKDVFHICGVFATISMFMVNMVSNGQLQGDAYTSGRIGSFGARAWFVLGFLMAFGSLIGACWILFGAYVGGVTPDFDPETAYPGVAIFLQNLLIFMASLVYRFGRTEDNWN